MEFEKKRLFGGGSMISDNKKETGEITERCISCHKDTGIPIATPISLRKYYVCGCGQLCEDCFDELNQDRIGERISEQEMEYLLEVTRLK